MRNPLHDSAQYLLNAHPRAGRCTYYLIAFAAQKLYDFILNLIGHGTLHVALVYDRNDFQIMFYCHIQIAYGLRLHTLCGIYHQQGALTCGYRARHLIREVHVSGSVNQVKDIFLTLVLILHLYGVALYCYAAFLLQIHAVKHLSSGYADGMSELQQTVGKR
ncbi:MAG: hypothetical protein BWY95_02547 [Bacteroidetes bacterium ADurb.BinA104]|nr:MAG: hypothetical protein BWY95_02547 [Bacteroidetes bacterium ADurb.BinA104]